MSDNRKKKFNFDFGNIDPMVIVLVIMLIGVLLTYVVPAGTYDVTVDESGITRIDVDSYARMEQTPVNPIDLPAIITSAFSNSISMIVLIGAGAGAFEVLRQTGAIDAIIGLTITKCRGKERLALWIMSLVFALLSCSCIPQVFIPFTPMCISLALALGYDAITGTGLLLLSTVVGGIAQPFSANTVAAQSFLGLPAYSGIGYRFVIFALYYLLSTFYLVRYAEGVKKDPSKSTMSSTVNGESYQAKKVDYPKLSAKHILTLAAVVAVVVMMVYGGMELGYGNYDIAGLFVIMGIFCGLVGGYGPSRIAGFFTQGVKQMTSVFLIIGLGTAVSSVLSSGNIIYTIIHAMVELLENWPVIVVPAGMMIIVCISNVIVPSLNGKMPMLLPILGPVCKALGVEQQLLVVAYAFGDSFTNFVLPYDSGLVGFLVAGNVPFGSWVRFFLKLEILWILMGSLIMIALHVIGMGPF